ncbi:MAG: HEAT repeat domain-containing protein [Cyanobacteria bacterium SID2]|nr:HEAT repeat domain-containing protein [Cyanobacteria bacterium SID2]MBP0006823.1 HEAT repeat domain-containing protein [Cyanobacteria bacterium SBC]
MHNDDLGTLYTQSEFDSPLDRTGTESGAENASPPDPEAMLLLLDAPETPQRVLAARAFCEIRDDRAIPKLIALLGDACPLVRVSAAYALGRNTSAEAVDPLITSLKDWNGYVRKGVVWALGNCRDRRAVAPLIDALKTDISAVRLWAASSLGQLSKLGYESIVGVVPPLIEGLRNDSISAVRSNCAWALGQLCRELPSNAVYAGAIDALLEALEEDQDMGVREDARSSLLRVGDPRGLQAIEDLEREGWL